MYYSCQPNSRKGPQAVAKAVPVMFTATAFCGIAAIFSLLLRGLV